MYFLKPVSDTLYNYTFVLICHGLCRERAYIGFSLLPNPFHVTWIKYCLNKYTGTQHGNIMIIVVVASWTQWDSIFGVKYFKLETGSTFCFYNRIIWLEIHVQCTYTWHTYDYHMILLWKTHICVEVVYVLLQCEPLLNILLARPCFLPPKTTDFDTLFSRSAWLKHVFNLCNIFFNCR